MVWENQYYILRSIKSETEYYLSSAFLWLFLKYVIKENSTFSLFMP